MSVHTKIIGLVGGVGAGKTTAAEYLVNEYGAKRFTLAKPLKEIVQRALDFSDEQMFGVLKDVVDPRYNFTPRHFMQRIGTEGVQSVLGKEFWTNYLLQCVERDDTKLVVIDDVRFLHEAAALRRWSSEDWRFRYVWLWRLEPRWRGVYANMTHQSENEWMRIECNEEIAPEKQDLDLFHGLLDQACSNAFIRKVSK